MYNRRAQIVVDCKGKCLVHDSVHTPFKTTSTLQQTGGTKDEYNNRYQNWLAFPGEIRLKN
jgi:hypothetical protein